MTAIPLADKVLCHAFLVFKTPKFFFSFIKNASGLTLQGSESLEDVSQKFMGVDRPSDVAVYERDSVDVCLFESWSYGCTYSVRREPVHSLRG